MKLIIKNVLLIGTLLNSLYELNSLDPLRALSLLYLDVGNPEDRTYYIFHSGQRFEVWKRPGKEVHRINLTPTNEIPSLAERMKHSIKAFLVHEGSLTFYTFVKPIRRNRSTIIAAELPFPSSSIPKDTDFSLLRRGSSFYYKGRKIRMWLDNSGKLVAVGLINHTNTIPIQRERIENNIRTHLASQNDFYFLVHTFPEGLIVGVELSPHNPS